MKVFSLCIIFISVHAIGQEPQFNDETLENMIIGAEESVEGNHELLPDFPDRVIDLNRAGTDQLQALPFLDIDLVSNLLNHIKYHGSLISLYELQTIAGFTPDIIKMLLPFISISEKHNHQHNKSRGHEMIIRVTRTLEMQQGFQSDSNAQPAFKGSPEHLLFRYKGMLGERLRTGFTAEKDAGEALSGHGPDFYSFNLTYTGYNTIRRIVLGDYQIQAGQGLSMWSGFAPKGASSITIMKRNGTGVLPYSSSGETDFLRGLAMHAVIKAFSISVYVSRRRIDGVTEYAGEKMVISSLPQSGLHRTTAELSNRKTITALAGGIIVSKRIRKLITGFNVAAKRYNLPYQQDSLTSVSTSGNLSWWYTLPAGPLLLYGESAIDQEMYLSGTTGIMLIPAQAVSVGIQASHVSKRFLPVYSIDGESLQGETSVSMRMIFRITGPVRLLLNAESHIHNMPKYRVDAPGGNNRADIRLTADRKKSGFYLWFKYSSQLLNSRKQDYAITPVIRNTKYHWRLHYQFALSDVLESRSRLEWSIFRDDIKHETGYMVFQEFVFKNHSRFTPAFRVTVFSVPSWDSRINASERDVLYGYSVPAFADQGTRLYGVLRIRIHRNLDCWVKISRTWLAFTEEIGSSYQTINGNSRTDFKVQLRLKF